jgi:predicted NUDIX family NTP pyrophosphohydrolase
MKISAGILPYRIKDGKLEVYLVYPGGPQNKKNRLWGLAKGGIEPGEDLIHAAKREFKEETSFEPPENLISIGAIQQRTDKIVHGWAGELPNLGKPVSNIIEVEVYSKLIKIPEISDGRYFPVDEALDNIIFGQREFIINLVDNLKSKDSLSS